MLCVAPDMFYLLLAHDGVSKSCFIVSHEEKMVAMSILTRISVVVFSVTLSLYFSVCGDRVV